MPNPIAQEVAPMLYKTMTLELIQENLSLYEKLRSSKMMLTALEAYAVDLRASHEQWKAQLSEDNPGSDPRQIASEALELAMLDLTSRLSCESAMDETEAVSLDAASHRSRRHSPTA
jgi:hypothetical protein